MPGIVLETTAFGMQWPTVDPFLFCVHHLDAYPPGTDSLGPNASLAGRDLGSDFAGIDGWRMYHGLTVPGFPQHPHRGFETVTYVRRGYVDHSDSLGATARFGRGDVQWLTAGKGIVHCEMFPLLERDAPNPCELFQIWLNLPAAKKLVEPHFTMLWDAQLPRVESRNDAGVARLTVIAGAYDNVAPPAPPPSSWAADERSDLAIWHLAVEPGAQITLPAAASDEVVRVAYVFEGACTVDDTALAAPTAAVLRPDADAAITSGISGAEILVLQGRPIGEPVAQYGPFVMNTEAEIEQAFAEYRSTGFGGWPWPTDDPVHRREQPRFARYPDGRVEEPAAS